MPYIGIVNHKSADNNKKIKDEKMKQQKLYILGAIFSLLVLTIISSLTFSFILHTKQNNSTPTFSDPDTIYVYVSTEVENTTDTEYTEDSYLIKEHNKKIGIFDKHGTLIQVIDVYIKALPKNDQVELLEGFWVSSEKELYSIIEAYSD